MEGNGAIKDPARALALMDRACALGDTSRCRDAQKMRERPKRRLRELDDLEARCRKDLPAICAHVGEAWRDGDDVAANPKRAAAALQAGCDGGDQSACAALAELRLAGPITPRDAREALTLLQAACDAGGEHACIAWSVAVRAGRGGPPDLAKADALLERVSTGPALYELAVRTLVGDGVPRNAKRGEELMARACAANVLSACAGP